MSEKHLERAVLADHNRPCLFHVAGPCFHPRCLEAHLVTLRKKEGLAEASPKGVQPPEGGQSPGNTGA